MRCAPYKPNNVILELQAILEPYVMSKKGKLSIANNPFEVIELLGENPPGFRVILLWDGDEDATGQPLAGIVRNRIHVIVSQNRGLRVWKGENLHKDYGTTQAMLTILSDVRAALRAHRFPPELTDQALLYQGTESEVSPEGLPLDAYRMRFTLNTALPSQIPS